MALDRVAAWSRAAQTARRRIGKSLAGDGRCSEPDESSNPARADRLRSATVDAWVCRSDRGSPDTIRDHTLLIVVDQFEELFRYSTPSPSEVRNLRDEARWREDAAHFVQLLLEAARDPAGRVRLLITMRSDFIGDCARFHGLPEAVSATQFLVPSLTRDQLEEIIRGPIEKAGATIEPPLVERLLNDSSDELDQLPVLQHCLLRLWEHAGQSNEPPTELGMSIARRVEAVRSIPISLRKIGEDHYRQIKGIAGALSGHADEILRALPGLEIAVEQVFRALSELDKEGRAVRRALPFAQLVAEAGVPDQALRKVVNRFRQDDCAFLLPAPSVEPELSAQTRIDVSHEALLRRWEKVNGAPDAISPADRDGWMRAEENDGRQYQALIALTGAAGVGDVALLSIEQVEHYLNWWNLRPRTAGWAERYGGSYREVQKVFESGLAALRADRKRREAVNDDLYRLRSSELHESQRRRRAMLSTTILVGVASTMLVLFLAGVVLWQWRLGYEQRNLIVSQREWAERSLLALSQLRSKTQLTDDQKAVIDAVEADLAKLARP
jgi:hypothetical protein